MCSHSGADEPGNETTTQELMSAKQLISSWGEWGEFKTLGPPPP